MLAIPFIILGGIFSGVFTPTESASVAAVVAIALAMFWFAERRAPRAARRAGAGGARDRHRDAAAGRLGDPHQGALLDRFGQSLSDFFTGITDNKYVFLLAVNLLLLAVGIFIEPLPALYILAPFMAPVAAATGSTRSTSG